MSPNTIFLFFITILIGEFILDKTLGALNASYFNKPIPKLLNDIYDEEEYIKSQQYKSDNYKFGLISSSFSLLVTLSFLLFDGFEYVDILARSCSNNSIVIGLIFFGIIMFASDILGIPFSIYHTFVIEESYGFNKTTATTFILDKIKGWIMTCILGGLILSTIIWFYDETGEQFWLYAWGIITLFSIVMNMFYAKVFVPLFNKQTPLEEGSLRIKIASYADSVGFKLDNIFVIDGSKRSTKANAYFSGFGSEKRITLYDTLIKELNEDEIVAVLAHEVGHYKKKHIIFNLIFSTLTTGFTLWLLSLFVNSISLSEALGVSEHSFHVGLIAFGILYSPISELTSLIMNSISRKFEYQADNYAADTFDHQHLISALKKLSKHSLSNLTPHPWYIRFNYSHPSLLQRIQNLSN